MWYKVAWLFLWMTLAFWAGCAGENQNYDINKQDIDTFQPPPEGGPAASGAARAVTSDDTVVSASESTPAPAGLSRDYWEPITVAPVDGRVPHHPRYFGNSWGHSIWGTWRVTEDRPSPLLASGDIEAEAARATGCNRWSFGCKDVCDFTLNNAKFALDTITLPGAVIVTPPCEIHYSPAE